MAKMVTLTIDDQKVTAPEGMVIVDAAKQVGIDIPVFCYHPKMEPVGMCRMCLVDIGRPVIDRATGQPVLEADGTPKIAFGPKLETACTTPISKGMVVVGLSDKVKAARKDMLEFLLTSHPLDCPVCDKGGECPLQNLTMRFGPGESRFLFDEKNRLEKRVPLGELIFLDRERCIQCARCVRFQADIVDDPVIGFYKRGRQIQISTSSEPGFDSYFSGNTTDICPVGALTTADFRFGARPWEMKTAASICTLCPVGCNTSVNVRREVMSDGRMTIKRIMPRQNEAVNEIWMCDKGRFAYKFAESRERLTTPLIRKDGKLVETSWDEALQFAASGIKTNGEVTALAGGRLSNEDLFVLSRLAANPDRTLLYSNMGGGDLVRRYGLPAGSNFKDMGKGTVIIIAGADLHEEAPIWWLRVKQAVDHGATLITIHPRKTRLERYAAFAFKPGYDDMTKTLASFLPGNALLADSTDEKASLAVKSAENLVIFFGSEGQTLTGSNELASTCAEILSGSGLAGKTNSGLIGVWPNGNTQGAWELGYKPVENLKERLSGAKSLVIAGADPAGDDPLLAKALLETCFVIVQELFLTETAKLADVVFPAASVMEREGTLTSGERRVQRYYPAVPPVGEAKPDFKISGLLAEKLGIKVQAGAASQTFAALASEYTAFKGLSYRSLSETAEQWPIIGRQDVYYGGTGYDNHQGLGQTLAPIEEEVVRQPYSRQAFTFNPKDGLLTLIPFERLYDRGTMMVDTVLLDQRKAGQILTLHPKTADALALVDQAAVAVEIHGTSYHFVIALDENAPEGVGLAPASVGLPLTAPMQVRLGSAEAVINPDER
jgi:NADH-quinone oxidoreductase subunit G